MRIASDEPVFKKWMRSAPSLCEKSSEWMGTFCVFHADGQKNFLFGCHRFLLLSINQDTSRPLSPWEIVSNISTTPSVLLSPKCTHCVQRSIRLPAAKTNAGGVIVLGGRQPGNESYAVSLRRCPKKNRVALCTPRVCPSYHWYEIDPFTSSQIK